MKTGCIWILVVASIIFIAATDASAGLAWTTGISSETTSSTNPIFQNFGGGGVTSVDAQGRWFRSLAGGAGTWADFTFTFPGVTFGTSETMRIYMDAVSAAGITAQVWLVNGTAPLTGPTVTLTNTTTLTRYNLPFTLSSGNTNVTSVTIRFVTGNNRVDIDAVATPEPTAFALFGLGLVACVLFRSRWRKRKKLGTAQAA